MYAAFSMAACVVCGLLVCIPGFFPSVCQNQTTCECAACASPVAGPFSWTGGCGYECDAGFFFDAGRCVSCTPTVVCPPGFMVEQCGHDHDTQCVPCVPPPGDGYEWMDQCEFACAPGFYSDGSGGCSPCRTDSCPAGTYMTNCTLDVDSQCLPCPAPPGPFEWVAGCAFQCSNGTFRDGEVCVECSRMECGLGQTFSACTADSDARCVDCAPESEGRVWGSGCDFQCATGFFQVDGGCSRCNASVACALGEYLAGCSGANDSFCSACSGALSERERWAANCGVECVDGYFHSPSGCAPCTSGLTCSAGFYVSECTAEADAQCARCVSKEGVRFVQNCQYECLEGYRRTADGCAACEAPSGTFVWASGECVFECATGFVLGNSTACVPVSGGTVALARVHAHVEMDNTVDEICAEIPTLLDAWSRVLSNAMGGGVIEFATNVTEVDGVACTPSGCPRCQAAAPYGGVFTSDQALDSPVPPAVPVAPEELPAEEVPPETTTGDLPETTEPLLWEAPPHSRRLLQSGSGVTVVSQSMQPVAAVGGVSSTQLTSGLRANLVNSSLQATSAKVNVTMLETPVPSKVLGLISEAIWALIGCGLVCMVLVAAMCIRVTSKKRRR